MPRPQLVETNLEEIPFYPHRRCEKHEYSPTKLHFTGANGSFPASAESCPCGMLRVRKGIFSPLNVPIVPTMNVVPLRRDPAA